MTVSHGTAHARPRQVLRHRQSSHQCLGRSDHRSSHALNANSSTPDFGGIYEALNIAGVEPSSIIAVSQCQFGKANIEALVDDDTIAFIHPGGVVAQPVAAKCSEKQSSILRSSSCSAEGMCRANTPMTADLASSESSSVVPATCYLAGSTGTGRPSGFATRPRQSWQSRKSAIAYWAL